MQLTPEQQQCYLRFVEASVQASSKADFIALIRDYVASVLPHQMFIAGIGRVLPDFQVDIFQIIPIDYPVSYLEEIKSFGGVMSPVMARWAKTREPQIYNPSTDTGSDITSEWLAIYNKYQIGNQAAHGVHDLHSSVTSYFSFCAMPELHPEKYCYLLRLFIPHLHIALLQALTRERENLEGESAPNLTARERSLLVLLLSGKSNAEIAQALHRSEKTIKNQLHTLYSKLDVRNRRQAIQRANELRGQFVRKQTTIDEKSGLSIYLHN